MNACLRPTRFPHWRRGVVSLVLSMACLHAVAQADAGGAKLRPLLTPWTSLTGAWLLPPRFAPSTVPQPSMARGYFSWQFPVAVAARGNFLYVVDGGRRHIFRYDPTQQSVSAFSNHSADAGSAIAVAADLSLYVTDSGTRQVLHFSFDGQLLQRFGHDMELAKPVSVVVDDQSGNIWVADGLYNHVVVFSSLGRLLAVLKSTQSLSIAALAQGPDGLYLLDPVGRQVVVIGRDGSDRYTVGNGVLKMPSAIATDRFGRVFVADSFDNSIKVFDRSGLLASVTNSGAIPASFNHITDLRLDQNTLYVADSLNRRIQTFRVEPAPPAALPRDRDQ